MSIKNLGIILLDSRRAQHLNWGFLTFARMEQQGLDLIEETLSHFNEGAKSVKAFSNSTVYIITRASDLSHYWVTMEAPGFPKSKATSLEDYFQEVYGIEAVY